MHLRDLQKLEGVLSPSHLEEEYANSLRQSKMNIRICQPGSKSDDVENEILFGNNQDAALQINQKEVRWGLLEDTLEERLEKAVWTLKNLRLKVKKGTLRRQRSMDVEKSILEDLRNRVQLNSLVLPSVSFYTFLNTHNGLNCSSISHDGSLVAGGFSDSSLKVWDMSKIGQANVQGEHESSTKENVMGSDEGKRPYTLFQGHAGPVYSATFSPLGDFILTSSSDSTIRLWSTKLNANLVCYKGHNYPVWDVQFSPVGHYFASASHDRTARIWSMDRIQPLRILAGHLSDVDCVQWHANCNYIATGSSDKTVRLWDVQSGECVRIFIGHRSMILSLAMSPDGRFMASGDEDGAIMMWDISSGRRVQPLMGHTGCVWTLAFSCEGSLLASGSADCMVKLWDVTASAKVVKTEEIGKAGNSSRLRLLKTLPTKSTPVYNIRFSRRNLLFASGAFIK
ncbi:hypothetical protein QJS10_CPB17g00212 [Acorus calamus]|uniref:Transcription initiation factor TFIID subunit 5 n=1 Tax=Acorus calamus TaxID=4465 RepID=A0AAV9CX33_ACOCL|nr:hypothetical protein QJS10_CPB17g00212 [Acorus calamus]